MAFDQTTRNRLARFVADARTLLSEEFTRQLQQEYGLDPTTGEVAALEQLTQLDDARRETARLLRDTLAHYLASAPAQNAKSRQEALDRIVREQAFTILNRLCALRMAEARGLLIESIGKGYQSRGFQLYTRLAGTALGETGDAYRAYLLSLFDEFAVDLQVLFDRWSPEGRLFPRETALLELLGMLDHPDIDALWAEDETIGWIYQYFNSNEERQAMRDFKKGGSQAPRNSRELAVRNQFFTPRYVVEFLTDNTLGRTWYEMMQGQTGLVDTCRYLVRRPTEIFLGEGEQAPDQSASEDDLSQEELLRQPVYIPHRPFKDPRDITMLDPACGSMHFGLYAFDLYERIYEEAWDLQEAGQWPVGDNDLDLHSSRNLLIADYSSKENFLRDVPRLIVERNIHGVDIDPRAVQIAGLSLWLRAQQSWRVQGIRAQDRPAIRRSNVVCAEPMPGEASMLEDFLRELRDDRLEGLIRRVLDVQANQVVRATPTMVDALSTLVRTVWKEMELAGEAGSLLKIEESLTTAIAKGRAEWEEKMPLFRVTEFSMTETLKQIPRYRYYKTIPGEEADFWDRAETLVLTALEDYATQVGDGGGFQRRLFAEDAVRGFAFIDLCRKRYDVVLMNPPFGEASVPSRDYLYRNYSHATQDIFAAFVDRGLAILQSRGSLGAITSRLAFYLELLEGWRIKLFGGQSQLSTMADLGYGVLDAALVEAAAYVVAASRSSNMPATFISLLAHEDKGYDLLQSCMAMSEGYAPPNCFNVEPKSFTSVPASRASYWVSQLWRNMFASSRNIRTAYGFPYVGLQTGADEFFLRLAWEVAPQDIGGIQSKWVSFAKGGEYAQFFADYHLLVNWSIRGLARRQSNSEAYFRPGVTYTERTTSNLSARILPQDCVFSPNGVTIVPARRQIFETVALLNSRVSHLLVEMCVGGGDAVSSGSAARHYGPRIIARISAPELTDRQEEEIASSVLTIWRLLRDRDAAQEPGRYFVSPFFPQPCIVPSLVTLAEQRQQLWEDRVLEIVSSHYQIDRIFADAFHLSESADRELRQEIGIHPAELPQVSIDAVDQFAIAYLVPIDELVDRAVASAGASRSLTKKTYVADRQIELLAQLFGVHPRTVVTTRRTMGLQGLSATKAFVDDVCSYAFGCAFGRWDIRLAADGRPAPVLSDPITPIPVCSPGMLQNGQGLPAHPTDVPIAYPIAIPWAGILVDDEGHREDVVGRVLDALRVLWKDNTDAIEQEASEILGVRSLRAYFGKPAAFFADHLSRYSKSRRQAPIYWPLSTLSSTYTLWLYYPRLTDQTLYTCINDFIDPKLTQVTEETTRLRQKFGRSSTEEKELERLSDLQLELQDFRAELLRIATFWKPNLNDGVQITAAPLWRLFQHRTWQKQLKETWASLEAGEYDWAHLAYSIWPERVREKCRTDKSLAIAHELEELYEEPKVQPKQKRGKAKQVVAETDGMFGDE